MCCFGSSYSSRCSHIATEGVGERTTPGRIVTSLRVTLIQMDHSIEEALYAEAQQPP